MEKHFPTSMDRSRQFDWQSTSHSKHRFTSRLHTQSLLTLVGSGLVGSGVEGSGVVGSGVVGSGVVGSGVVVVVCFTYAGVGTGAGLDDG